MQGVLVDDMREADLVVFTGGEDVDPRMYKTPRHPKTYCNLRRDMLENAEMVKAERLGKHMIGICRGMQLMCVYNGGMLIQHQDNPGTHMVETFDGKRFLMSSLHHQAAYPFDLPEDDWRPIAWTKDLLRMHEDWNEHELNPPIELEAIWFPKTKCFGIQGHPEMMDSSSSGVLYFQNLLNLFLQDKLTANVSKEITNR